MKRLRSKRAGLELRAQPRNEGCLRALHILTYTLVKYWKSQYYLETQVSLKRCTNVLWNHTK